MKHIISQSKRYLKPGVCQPWLYEAVQANVCAALAEDRPEHDSSTRFTETQKIGEASLVSNEAAVISGLFWADEVFHRIGTNITLEWYVKDGQSVPAKQRLCTIRGPLPAMLRAERCALNFLQTLSGTATTVAHYVAQLGSNSRTLITDTRKTIPGLRWAQKYAVVCGGGSNHRCDLSDGILLKDNHIAMYSSIAQASAAMRRNVPDKKIEIEVSTLSQVHLALTASADVIMLDNFAMDDIPKAVDIIRGRAKVEVSGNLRLADIKTLVAYGVDYVSIGALTKHLQAIDMSIKVHP